MSSRSLLAKMRVRTFDYFPYLATYVYSLTPHARKGLGTMAVDQSGNLYYDPAFVSSISNDEGAYTVLHEALHVVFKHHERAKEFYGNAPTEQMRYVINVAADLVIEQVLTPIVQHRPAGCLHLGCRCKRLGMTLDFPPDLRMEEYVRLILDRMRDAGSDGGQPQQSQDGSSLEEDDDAQPHEGGSCADGIPRDYEVQPDGAWESFGESQAAHAAMDAIEKAEHDEPGSVPATLKEVIKARVTRVRDPWAELQTVVARCVAAPVGGRDSTYRRISRKQIRGAIRLRGYQTATPSAVVIRDTSGSMCSDEIQAKALSCIASGLRKLSRFKVISADTRIQSREDVSSLSQIVWHGGGGTDMGSIIEQVDREESPDSIVIVTDCITGWPALPTRARLVVAAISAPDNHFNRVPSWARKIRITD